MNIEEIDKHLYYLLYNQKVETEDEALEADTKVLKYWYKIKNNKEILKEALKLKKDDNGKDTFSGKTICDLLLCEYKNIPDDIYKDIYKELIKVIYSNKDIARDYLVNDDDNDTFLTMTLWNSNLLLTEEQKAFAVEEAMNQLFTTKYFKIKEDIIKMINASNILKDYDIIDINFINKGKENNYDISSDIRYYILRNPNWSLEEKKQLVYEFYNDDEIYESLVNYWITRIINLINNDYSYQLTINDLFTLKEEQLMEIYKEDINNGLEIIKDIELIKVLNIIRPISFLEKDNERGRILS